MRQNWADSAKGVAITLVVVTHVLRGMQAGDIIPAGSSFDRADGALYLIHIPIFFAVSGYFFEASTLRQGIIGGLKRRVVSLLWPLVLWSYVTAAFRLLAGGSANHQYDATIANFVLYPLQLMDVFWFLWALFLIQTVASLVVACRPPSWVYAAVIVLGIAVSSLPFVTSVYVAPALHHIPNFFAGMLLARALLGGSSRPSGGLATLGLAAAIFAVGLAIWGLSERPSGLLQSGLEVLASAGFLVFWAGAMWNVRMPVLDFLGRISMAVFVTHVIFTAATRIALLQIGVTDPAVHLLVGTAAGLAFPVLVYAVAARLNKLALLGFT